MYWPAMKNRYVNRAKISEAKFRDLVRFFALDLTASQIAEITGLNRNTVNRYLTEIRKKITRHCELTNPATFPAGPPHGGKEFDSWSVLIREDNGRIYTEIGPPKTVIDLGKSPEMISRLHSCYNLLIDTENGKHHVLGEKSGDPGRHRTRINRIESFWGSAKSRLAKFKGMHSSTFRYHLKECEFRFNHRGEDLYHLLLKILRKDPLF